jgi:hypothetical protein
MATAKKTPEQEAADLIAEVEGEPTARPSCPAPEVCFPDGIDPSWSSIGCVHGQYDLA